MFHGIPDFYLTSGAVDYMAVIVCAHLVAVKCGVFTTTSTRKYSYALGQQPSWLVPLCFRQITYPSPLQVITVTSCISDRMSNHRQRIGESSGISSRK